MNLWDAAENHHSRSGEAQNYFDGLRTHIDKRISELADQEKRIRAANVSSNWPSIDISQGISRDNSGNACYEYQCDATVVRVYVNQPVGFLYCEIEQLVPSTGKMKGFAIKCGPRGFRGVDISLIGDVPKIDYPGWVSIGDFIVEKLLTGEITPELIAEREQLFGMGARRTHS